MEWSTTPINKFRGFVQQVENFNQSGASAEDQLNQALRLFSEDQKSHFKHLCCDKLLVKSPKWSAYCIDNNNKSENAKQKRARSPSSKAPQSNALG
ncbi:hypothetical protein PTTG_09922 [Puccinia triticina 1-1 BBBD Race 1]|uniref:NAM-associated domain-containing protein n=1 Tax=Puccinia triticina (isolate 1-1 / race 1 (BBBD)) TaxID=630390 RepID=A0A180G364_PUCT1|nr:hypothetical protein PTTG_09922 [Puccinia triticina 1-1 BBBD Race 1]